MEAHLHLFDTFDAARDPRYVKDGFCILGIKPCAISRKDGQLFVGDSLYSVPVYDNCAGESTKEGTE